MSDPLTEAGNLFAEEVEKRESETPANEWRQDADKRALDELFHSAQYFRTGRDYKNLLEFICRFKVYSPFNAMLVRIQKPGAEYVLRASDWWSRYQLRLAIDAQAIVILQPMGPVMFVFDVSDTVGDKSKLPKEVVAPFEVHSGLIGGELERVGDNCLRDGVEVRRSSMGSQLAGQVRSEHSVSVQAKMDEGRRLRTKHREPRSIPVRYSIVLNQRTSRESQFATLVHELGHLYCGHVGTPRQSWWPDRRGLEVTTREFEAESVAFLVCLRLGIDPGSDQYLSNYLGKDGEIPEISLERVMAAAGLIEQMCTRLLPPRKETP